MSTKSMFNMPRDIYYSNGHTWARVENGLVRVGVDDFFQKLAGAIVYVDLPSVGGKVQHMRPWGVISSTNQKANRAFIAPSKEYRFDLQTLGILAMRGGFCHCRLGERCPCARVDQCPCQAYVPINYLVSPISGIVKEVNLDMNDSPWDINMDPYGKGWLVAVEPTDLETDLKQLITGEAVTGWLSHEMEAKKDFVEVLKQALERYSKE